MNTNEPHKFVLNLSQRLVLKSSNKHVSLITLIFYLSANYNCKTIRQQYKNNKLKKEPTWNDEFERPGGSFSVMSDIQDYINYILKKRGTLPTNPPFENHINRINKKLVFKIKDGYKLELQTPETMKLFCSTKVINRQNKESGTSYFEVVLVQCNVVDNQYQQNYELLYTLNSISLMLICKCGTKQVSVFENL